MIVYFFKKSKELILIWIKRLLIGVVLLYGFFILIRVQLTHNTLQIIQNSQTNQLKTQIKSPQDTPSVNTDKGAYVASKRGTYYYPINCNKAQALAPQNMLYFKDKMSAERAGYKPHSGCK